jgi:phosphatidylserine/phosphatidylglycerophosphate/cardiolipin synthase-like enzyme
LTRAGLHLRQKMARATPMRKLPILFLIFLTACIQTVQIPPTPVDTGSPFQVFFTDPFAAGARQRKDGMDEAMERAIDAARSTVDIAMLNINLDGFGDALVRAHRRGVQVRLVMESASLDGNVPRRLEGEGIPLVGDRRESLMHNKFMVIDNSEVWTGSLNLTDTGTYDDHNNMIRIRSSRVAEDYTVEFNEMFVEDLFGDNARAATPNPMVTVDGFPVEVYFSPDDGVLEHLIQVVRDAQSSINFLAFSFTADTLAQAMIEKSRAGVAVRGVFDSDQIDSNQGGDYDWMANTGLDVRRDSLPGQMHNKIIIIDDRVVVTGSYNFSNSAERRNDENIVIIHDPQTAGLYRAEFEAIFERAD